MSKSLGNLVFVSELRKTADPRAIRLALVNIGGAIPGIGDMSTFGSPAKYSYVVAENEAENPWQPLHVDRGFPREASTVTVIGAESPHTRIELIERLSIIWSPWLMMGYKCRC